MNYSSLGPGNLVELSLLLALASFTGFGGVGTRNAIHNPESGASNIRGVPLRSVSKNLDGNEPIEKPGGCEEARVLVKQAEAWRKDWQRHSLEGAISNYKRAQICWHNMRTVADEADSFEGSWGCLRSAE